MKSNKLKINQHKIQIQLQQTKISQIQILIKQKLNIKVIKNKQIQTDLKTK